MKKLIGFLVVFFTINISLAQPEKAEVEWKEGKKYYVHFVQAGNTLYGLTKLYNMSAEEIIAVNPEISKGLKEGQKLLIPAIAGAQSKDNKEAKPAVKDPKASGTPKTNGTHTVSKSETLYGISKKYNVTMEQMVKANPGIENGISIGQVLNIPDGGNAAAPTGNTPAPTAKPQPQVTFYDTTITHVVLEHETMYSISKRFMVPVEDLQKANDLKNNKIKPGETIKIPLKKEKYSKVEVRQVEKVKDKKVDEELLFKAKDEYVVLMLLPFGLDKGKDGITGISTEFLMGAQIALDSLQRLGLNARVHVLDAGTDSMKLKQLLQQKEYKSADLIIGPFMGENLEVAARWCKANKVRMISPIMAQTNILKENAFVYNAVASDISLMQGMAKYIVENHSKDQIVLVKGGAKDEDLYQAFRQKFMTLSNSGAKQKLIEIDQADLGTYIRKGSNTVFVVPSRDKVNALKFMNALHKVANKSGSGVISVFGTKEWASFDDIKGYFKNKYNFHYASSNDFSYTYPATKDLMRNYRRDYNADLSKYGTQGFDVTFYFIRTLLMEKKAAAGVMNNIQMVSTGSGNGLENKACFILKQQDYEIVKVGEVNE